jgi:hypothetical protein
MSLREPVPDISPMLLPPANMAALGATSGEKASGALEALTGVGVSARLPIVSLGDPTLGIPDVPSFTGNADALGACSLAKAPGAFDAPSGAALTDSIRSAATLDVTGVGSLRAPIISLRAYPTDASLTPSPTDVEALRADSFANASGELEPIIAGGASSRRPIGSPREPTPDVSAIPLPTVNAPALGADSVVNAPGASEPLTAETPA